MNVRWLLLLLLLVGGGVYYFLCFSPPSRALTNEVYLTRYASIMTASGVYGFPPGTKLTLEPTRPVPPGTVAVTDGKHQLAVETDALTRNPELAQQYAAADQKVQVQAIAAAKAAKEHVIQVETAAQLKRAQDLDRFNGMRQAQPTVTPATRPVGPVSSLQRIGGG